MWPNYNRLSIFSSTGKLFFGFIFTVINEKEKDDSTRCLLRISNTGHAYSRSDITSLGFTKDECQILASRQRATNYLLYMYSERVQPVLREDGRKGSRSLNSDSVCSWRLKNDHEKSENKTMTVIRRNNGTPRMLNKRLCCSGMPTRKEKSERLAPPRSASLTVLQTEASIDDSLGAIIIRSINQDLSPSARLERYLINLQRKGYLTSARKERKKNIEVELDRGITPKGVVSLRSKFLPHPPVYLFERAVKDSPFNKSI